MKLLVISDSHRRTDRMLYAFGQCNPDAVLHLGDHISDGYELQRRFLDVPFYMVKGNCDFQEYEETELILSFESVKIFMTHGHIYGVKGGLKTLSDESRRIGADIALFGHTHQAVIKRANGSCVMNPGQMERHDNKRAASYGIITVNGGQFTCDLVYLPQQLADLSR